MFTLLFRLSALLLLLQFVGAANARDDCPEQIIETLSRKWAIKPGSEILATSCKNWPADDTKLLVALSFAPAGLVRYSKDLPLHVALVQVPAGRALNHLEGTIREDASWNVRGSYFTWDTARYRLAKGVRAVALRENGFIESGAMDHGAEDRLTLYILSGRTFRPVLLVPHMRFWRYTLTDKGARGEAITAKLTLSVQKTSSNGFADLLASAKEEKTGRTVFTHLLTYDGTSYPNEKLIDKIDGWWQ